ncbi:MAG: sialate O-acetylesterase [Bacteroidota bacterium]
MKHISIIFFTTLFFTSCKQEPSLLKVHGLFTDNTILQQNTDAVIWGWANKGTKVKITTDWDVKVNVVTDNKGNWKTILKTPSAGGPFIIKIEAHDTLIQLSNILIGEVWLASGQSNMEMPVKGWPPNNIINNSEKEIANSNNNKIRMFSVEKNAAYIPEKNLTGKWKPASSENTGNFSATAYFFAREIHKNLNIPVGIIHASWGGTPIEPWIEATGLQTVPNFEKTAKQLIDSQKNIPEFNKWLVGLKYINLDSIDKKNPYANLDLGNTKLKEPDYDDTDWKTMKVPGEFWEKKEIGNYDGVAWFRKEFTMPENIEVGDYEFYLGKIDDMDDTYINGEKLGSHMGEGYWNLERLYTIKSELLKPGKNVIAVRVIDSRGNGGIYGDKDITLSKNGKQVVNLSGEWKFKPTALISLSDLYVFNDDGGNYGNMPEIAYTLSSFTPTHLFNGMIAPLIPYSIKGAIWYQGESNVGRGKEYQSLFPALIKSWRKSWNIGDFPFYFVQIAPYNYGDKNFETPELRHAQFLTLKEDNVGMVVTTDIGDIKNVHPANKQEVGRRLSFWALAKTYSIDSINYSGPIYKNSEISDNKLLVNFTNVDGGLVCKDDEPNFFEIAGADTIFYPAKAQIVDEKVEVWSKKVLKPQFVRFGWLDIAEPNLFNKSGLPASPFRNY